jgi:hypothetical protein
MVETMNVFFEVSIIRSLLLLLIIIIIVSHKSSILMTKLLYKSLTSKSVIMVLRFQHTDFCGNKHSGIADVK